MNKTIPFVQRHAHPIPRHGYTTAISSRYEGWAGLYDRHGQHTILLIQYDKTPIHLIDKRPIWTRHQPPRPPNRKHHHNIRRTKRIHRPKRWTPQHHTPHHTHIPITQKNKDKNARKRQHKRDILHLRQILVKILPHHRRQHRTTRKHQVQHTTPPLPRLHRNSQNTRTKSRKTMTKIH